MAKNAATVLAMVLGLAMPTITVTARIPQRAIATSGAPVGTYEDDTWEINIAYYNNALHYHGKNKRTGDALSLSGTEFNRQPHIYVWRNGDYRYQVDWQSATPSIVQLQVFDPSNQVILNRSLQRRNRLELVPPESRRNLELEQAILRSNNISRDALYAYNFVDLNSDGRPEVIVSFWGHVSVCPRIGCETQIYQRAGQSYRLIESFTYGHPPLIVTRQKTRGWNDLVVNVDRLCDPHTGRRCGSYLAKFNGQNYPGIETETIRLSQNQNISGQMFFHEAFNSSWHQFR